MQCTVILKTNFCLQKDINFKPRSELLEFWFVFDQGKMNSEEINVFLEGASLAWRTSDAEALLKVLL